MSAALEMASAATAMRFFIWCNFMASGLGGPTGAGGVAGSACCVSALQAAGLGAPQADTTAVTSLGPPTPSATCGTVRQFPMAFV